MEEHRREDAKTDAAVLHNEGSYLGIANDAKQEFCTAPIYKAQYGKGPQLIDTGRGIFKEDKNGKNEIGCRCNKRHQGVDIEIKDQRFPFITKKIMSVLTYPQYFRMNIRLAFPLCKMNNVGIF